MLSTHKVTKRVDGVDFDQKNQITAGYNAASMAVTGDAPKDQQPGFVDLVARASRDNKHVFFGEPHVNGMVVQSYQLLADNPGVFQKAKENGIGHLVLELPHALQPSLDKLSVWQISKEQFKSEFMEQFTSEWMADPNIRNQFSEALAQTIENAHNAGMKVHMADVTHAEFFRGMNSDYPPDLQRFIAKVTEDHKEQGNGMTLQQYTMSRMASLPSGEREDLLRQAREHVNKVRHERLDDSEQYSYLRGRIPQNEGIMGLVGLSHLDNNLDFKMEKASRGIDDFLEEEGGKVASIELHNTDSKKAMASTYEEDNAIKLDKPDYTVIIDQNQIFDKQDRVVGSLDQTSPADRTVEKRPSVSSPAPGAGVY